jgi:hypothetical protein
MEDGLRMVRSRTCGAWTLPGDPTCAGVARRLFRLVASGLGLETEAIDDGVTMVSELAANTLHVQQRQPAPASPELWLYLRGTGPRAELVCKVFDTLPGWVRGNVPGRTVSRAPADAMSGRGLEVVHEMSSGRWGHHLSRSRLAGTSQRGKAVWFALPAPAAGLDTGQASDRGTPASAGEAMTELEKDLGTRGFGDKLVRADDPGADMAVLSIASGLTVWCRSGAAWLRAPGPPVRQWSYYDLVEVGEQAVGAYETSIARYAPGPLAAATRTGALAGHAKHGTVQKIQDLSSERSCDSVRTARSCDSVRTARSPCPSLPASPRPSRCARPAAPASPSPSRPVAITARSAPHRRQTQRLGVLNGK